MANKIAACAIKRIASRSCTARSATLEAVVPDGWVSYQESENLLAQSGTAEQ